MTRRRFIQDPETGDLMEVGLDYMAEPRNNDQVLWNDRIYQDGSDSRFTSRSQHRDYMKAKGLTTTDDYDQSWFKAEQRRIAERRAEVRGERKSDIVESIHKLQAGYKPVRREE